MRRGKTRALRLLRLCRGGRADQHVGIDRQQARGGQILMRLHVIDPPDDQITGRGIDVEEVGASLDLANPRHMAAIDFGDRSTRQALGQSPHGGGIPRNDGTGARGRRSTGIGDARQSTQGEPENGQQAQK